MMAYQEKLVPDLDQPLKIWFSFFSSDLRNRTLREVLEHRSKLPAIFEETEDLPSRDEKIRFFLRRIDETYRSDEENPKLEEVYSDIGFMVLGILLEQIRGKRLRDLLPPYDFLKYGPVSFPGSWMSVFFPSVSQVASILSLDARPQWLNGRVQSPRAYWLEGDAGHAGLFGRGKAIDDWGKNLFLSYHGKGIRLSDKTVRSFIDFENRRGRFLNGFDTPSEKNSQAGDKLSRTTTIGHLGFTGCSFWMDIESGYRITLLTNRAAPGVDPETLRKLRPGFHDWLLEEVFSTLS